MVYLCMLTSCFYLLPIGSVRNSTWRRDTPALEERRFLILQKWFSVASEPVSAFCIFYILKVALLCLLMTWWLAATRKRFLLFSCILT